MATPGAGKTTFALRVAAELLAAGEVRAVTVVVPTEHLKNQWAAAAARAGIHLDATFRNADLHSAADLHGAVVTYAQVGAAPQVHRRRTMARPTLAILDEIHHAGDSRTWGDGVAAAFGPAARRLDAHRHTVSVRRQSDPVRHLRAGSGRAAALASRRPTATPTRSPTVWYAR